MIASCLLLMATTQDCHRFAQAELVGTIQQPELVEASGLASSTDGTTLWSHNDSSDAPRIFAFGMDGSNQGIVEVQGVQAIDWEDIAIGPCGEERCVYIGDFGDNGSARQSVSIVRLIEPTAPGPGRVVQAEGKQLEYNYPEGPRDAEGLAIDPQSGDLLVVSKLRNRPQSEVFRIPIQAWDNEAQPIQAIPVGVVSWDGEGWATQATSAALTPQGEYLYIQTYTQALWVPLKRADGLIQELGSTGPAPAWSLGQCEAATLSRDGRTLWFTCEATEAPLAKADCLEPRPEPTPVTPEVEQAKGCAGCSTTPLHTWTLLLGLWACRWRRGSKGVRECRRRV